MPSGPERADRTAFPLDTIVARYRAEPSRTWSLVITVFGDAILPRGGSVWLGTLLALLRPLGIEEGAVRTAMSRLTADGWLTRTRIGRNSFYRLAERGRETFGEATEHIYNPRVPAWSGRLRLVFPEANDAAAGAALEAAGFGTAAPGVHVAPSGIAIPDAARDAITVEAEFDPEAALRLARRAWPLDRMGGRYRSFAETFRPLVSGGAAPPLSDHEALLVRILMIHAYRRVILRDPILPPALLPADWPGRAARALCANLYGALLAGSETWLDRHGLTETGPLPSAGPDLAVRFGGTNMLQ